MTSDISKIVRDAEKIIDNAYKDLPIFKYPLDVALYALLAAFDSDIYTERMVRDLCDLPDLTVSQAAIFKFLGEGFVIAMRWLLDGRDPCDVLPVADDRTICDAHQLIEYGSAYHQVAMMYSLYSQGTMVAEAPAPNTIRFRYEDAFRAANHAWGYHDEVSRERLVRARNRRAYLDQQFNAATQIYDRVPYTLDQGRVVLGDVSMLRSPEVSRYTNSVLRSEHIFSERHDLGGYTIGDFNRFWHGFHCWSECAAQIYLTSFEGGTAQKECAPTQVIATERFLENIVAIADISRHAASTIMRQLAFDYRTRTKRPDCFLQPLICGRGSVSWSVRTALFSRSQRNLLKLMARTPSQKALADSIIGSREADLLNSLKVWLETKGWSCATNRPLTRGTAGEVDLLAVNWRVPSEVLVVEAKALLQPDDVNEVRAASDELLHAQEQVRRSIKVIGGMSAQERSALFPFVEWDKVQNWYGVVITPEAEPGFNVEQSIIPACSFATLREHLKRRQWASPLQLWRAMTSREWHAEIQDAKSGHETIELAGLRFEIPCRFINENPRSKSREPERDL
jgi:hypothetical protein